MIGFCAARVSTTVVLLLFAVVCVFLCVCLQFLLESVFRRPNWKWVRVSNTEANHHGGNRTAVVGVVSWGLGIAQAA